MRRHRFWIQFRRASLIAPAWSVLGFLVLPILIILPVSLTDTPYLSLPQSELSLQHYEAFFSESVWLSATFQSIVIATGSTFLAVVLGTTCAIGCWRLSNGFADAVRLLLLMPMIIPPVVQGVAYFRFWAALGLFDTYLGMIIAHTIVGLPFVTITVSASLANFDPKLEQAARSLGGSTLQTVRYVVVPNIAPGLLSGALFAFAHSFDEVVIPLFITSRNIYTLPKRIWDGVRESVDPTVAAAAMVLVTITVGLLLLKFLIEQLRSRVSSRSDHGARNSARAGRPQEA